MLVVAIDIGGTFTDLLGFDEVGQKSVQAKSLTTPAALVQGIIDCLASVQGRFAFIPQRSAPGTSPAPERGS